MNNKPVSKYKAITNTKIEPTVVSYTHPVKELPTKEDEYWLMVEVLRAKVKEQQAEIEALKALLVEEQDESFDRTASHMAGEYVSYQKELTDEEINWLAKAYSTMEGELNAPAFARAILRKAQK